MHILSVSQFNRFFLDRLFTLTKTMRQTFGQAPLALKEPYYYTALKGFTIAMVFDEPSTRTKSSFEAAIMKLGGHFFSVDTTNFSMKKGETFEDTIKTISQYADAIVLRHSNVGAANLAASISEVPVINAGDGSGEHPTQALIDVFTIIDELADFKKVTFLVMWSMPGLLIPWKIF